MGILQREFQFLERNVQRVKTKLQKLQYDLTLTPSTNTADLWPKHLICQHDYHTMTQSKVHDTYDHGTYRDSYSVRQQQIRLDVMFSRQIQAEEQIFLAEHIKKIENKWSLGTNVTKGEIRSCLTPFLQMDIMMTRDKKNIIVKKGLKIQNSQDSFKDRQI